MPDKKRTGVIVLAAGSSARMGSPKQLLSVAGTSLIRHAASAALDGGGDPVVVVLGANWTSISSELEGLNVELVVNSHWEEGMASSIHSGLRGLLELQPDISGVLLTVADQPLVTGEILRSVITAGTKQTQGLAAATHGNSFGTPAYFSEQYFPELMELTGAEGARRLLERNRTKVAAVNVPEARLDIDTPEEFAAFTKSLSHNFISSHISQPRPAASIGSRHNTTTAMETFDSDNTSGDPPGPLENGAQAASQTRRQFIGSVTAAGAGVVVAPAFLQSAPAAEKASASASSGPTGSATIPVKLSVNGKEHSLELDPRVTLLDALRERLDLTGTKKGCDHGQCGACTVLVNGRRDQLLPGARGRARRRRNHDDRGPGEGRRIASRCRRHSSSTMAFNAATARRDRSARRSRFVKEDHAGSDDEIREWMSGNICRCGAYTNIVAAIRDAQNEDGGRRMNPFAYSRADGRGPSRGRSSPRSLMPSCSAGERISIDLMKMGVENAAADHGHQPSAAGRGRGIAGRQRRAHRRRSRGTPTSRSTR